jgi:tRNA pseudouridine55 synthase
MHGLLLIDKPSGLSSHDVVRQVRRLFKTRKVGHAGTLDPLATGVLPVAIGEGTKLLQFLLAEEKAYRATMRLGVTTDTLDSEGAELTRVDIPLDVTANLPTLLKKFMGEIEQIPPMYSALKRNGVPLYKLARAGQVVEREARRVTIKRLELLDTQLPDLTIEVECTKGTYIRSLCADLGEALGCGGHVIALRRLRTGQYPIERCVPLDQLGDLDDLVRTSAFMSVDEALSDYPAAELVEEAANRLNNGISPEVAELTNQLSVSAGDLVRLVFAGRLMAMARYAPERQNAKRGDFELARVFNCHAVG